MKYALIGEKLGHSFSKPIHNLFGNNNYEIVEVPRDNLENFIINEKYVGLNVTIPYKKDVMDFCNELSDAAINIGSVNTLIKKDNCIIGDNTDLYGFLSSADSIGIDFNGKKTVIFGSGGTSNTVSYAVKIRGGTAVIISRSGENNYDNLCKHFDADYIVNTTPIGMYPNFDGSVCDLSLFSRLCGVIDVVYNPLKTRLLQQAERLNINHIGGLHMLVSQAKRAEELFFDKIIDISVDSVIKKVEMDITNIAIVGMPGSGKTTIGRTLANKLGMDFVDIDKMIEEKTSSSIPDLFKNHGEPYFRTIESECIKEVSVLKKTIISTGGGAILADENRANLKMNSKVIFIMRDIDKLASNGRPLSQSNEAISKLAKARLPIYREVSDHSVNNNGSISDAVCEIERIVYNENSCD